METRILSEEDVTRLLPMNECISVMADVLSAAAQGKALNPLRTALRFPSGKGLLGLMPAYLEEPESAGIKVVTVMPGNHGTEYDSHQGTVLLFETEHGSLLAVLDASTITGIRTAAVSGVATAALARKGAQRLAILGSGVQAQTHLDSMLSAFSVSEVRVWSRSERRAQSFAGRQNSARDIRVRVSRSVEEAVESADVICTTTAATEPILKGRWLCPGVHLNAVGACLPSFRELDTEAISRSRLFVDSRESVHNESGDFLIPREEGAIGDDHIVAELGEVLIGKCEGRRSEEEITIFKSLGLGIEDLAAAHYVYRKARRVGAGTTVELGGRRLGVD